MAWHVAVLNLIKNIKLKDMSKRNKEDTEQCVIPSVNSRCKNCNEPIHFDEFTKTWMHERSIAFFDNAWYCDNLHRTTGAEPID